MPTSRNPIRWRGHQSSTSGKQILTLGGHAHLQKPHQMEGAPIFHLGEANFNPGGTCPPPTTPSGRGDCPLPPPIKPIREGGGIFFLPRDNISNPGDNPSPPLKPSWRGGGSRFRTGDAIFDPGGQSATTSRSITEGEGQPFPPRNRAVKQLSPRGITGFYLIHTRGKEYYFQL